MKKLLWAAAVVTVLAIFARYASATNPIQVQVQAPASGASFTMNSVAETTAAAGSFAPWSNIFEYTWPSSSNVLSGGNLVMASPPSITGYAFTKWWVPQTNASTATLAATLVAETTAQGQIGSPGGPNVAGYYSWSSANSTSGVCTVYDPINQVIYLMSNGDKWIQKFNINGKAASPYTAPYITSWIGAGTNGTGTAFSGGGNTELLAVSPDGNYVYAVESTPKLIQKYTSTGSFVTSWTTTNTVAGLAVDCSGNVYVGGGGTISEYTATGTVVVSLWAPTGRAYSGISGIAFDGRGYMYIGDNTTKFVGAYTGSSASWTFQTSISGNGSTFTGVGRLACDANNNLYIATTGATLGVQESYFNGTTASTVQNITASGTVGWTISVDSVGNLYTMDWSSGKLLVDYYGVLIDALYTPTYTLTVNSTPPTGLAITSSTSDGGTTNYPVTVIYQTNVNLVAPVADPSGYTFTQWLVGPTTGFPAGAVAYDAKSITFSMLGGPTTAQATYSSTATGTLTVQSTLPGGVAVTSTGAYAGTTNYTVASVSGAVNLTAPAVSGYNFTQWIVGPTSGFPTGATTYDTATINFTMPVAATTAQATYSSNASSSTSSTLTVQSTPPTGVPITSTTGDAGTTNYVISSVATGSNVNLTAPAVSGYNFSQWIVGPTSGFPTGAVTYDTATITFPMPAGVATTAQATYSPSATGTLTVQSAPPTGVVIIQGGSDNTGTSDGGTTTYAVASVPSGTTVSLVAPATAPGGYNFVQWMVGPTSGFPSGATATASTTFTYTMPVGNLTAEAQYQFSGFTLTVQCTVPAGVLITKGSSDTTGASDGGFATPTGYTVPNVPSNSIVDLKVPSSDPTGYAFAYWTVNGTPQTAGLKEITPAITGVTTLVAQYNATLSVSSSGASSVVITSSTGHNGTTNYTKTNVANAASVNLVAPATDPAGYAWLQWVVGPTATYATGTIWPGATVYSSKTLNFNMPTATTTAQAQYTATYALKVNSTPVTGLTITSSNGQGGVTNYTLAAVGSTQTVTLTAPATDTSGNNFVQWIVGPTTGFPTAAAATYDTTTISFPMPAAATTAQATYSASAATTLTVQSSPVDLVAITSTTSDNGSTNYTKTATSGNNVNLTAPATDPTGFAFAQWLVGPTVGFPTGATAYATKTINFNMPSSATTAEVQYNCVLTVNGSAAGYVIVSPTGQGGTTNYTTPVARGTTVTLQAQWCSSNTAAFGSWTLTGATASSTSGNQITFTMPAAAVTALANYPTPNNLIVQSTSTAQGQPTGGFIPGVALDGAFMPGVAIAGTYPGTTNYMATFVPTSTVITLSAPASANGYTFSAWALSGATNVGSGTTCSFVMPSATVVTAMAQYTTIFYPLAVASTGTPGVAITGTYPGTTGYTTLVAAGNSVTLTAPTVSGLTFSNWTLNGAAQGAGVHTVTFNMPTASELAVANYAFTNPIAVQVEAPWSGVVIGSSDSPTHGGTTAAAFNTGDTAAPWTSLFGYNCPITANVAYNTASVVNVQDPTPPSGYAFVQWWVPQTNAFSTSANSTFASPAQTSSFGSFSTTSGSVWMESVICDPVKNVLYAYADGSGAVLPKVFKYTLSGTLLTSWTGTGTNGSGAAFVQGGNNNVCVSPDGNYVYVLAAANASGGLIQKYDSTGYWLTSWTDPNANGGIAVGPDGNVYATYGTNQYIFSPTGQKLGYWSFVNLPVGYAWNHTENIAFDGRGYMYVGSNDTTPSFVAIYAPTGTGYGVDAWTFQTVVSAGNGTAFSVAFTVACDANNNFYVSQGYTAGYVMEFNYSNGVVNYVRSFTSTGMSYAFAMTVDSAGNVYTMPANTSTTIDVARQGMLAQAQYTPIYTLTVNDNTASHGLTIGSTTGHGNVTNYSVPNIQFSTGVNLSAPTPDPTGYTFAQWTVNGTAQTAALKSITFLMLADTTALAQYTLNSYTLQVQSTPPTGLHITGTYPGTTNYTVTPNVPYNTSVTLTAPDVTGYTFNNWTGVTGTPSGNTITFTMPASTTTAVANYTSTSAILVVNSTPMTGLAIGSSTGAAGTTDYSVSGISPGGSVDLQAPATDPTGYTFSQWTWSLSGVAQTSTVKEITTTLPSDGMTALASYSPNPYTLTVQSNVPAGVLISHGAGDTTGTADGGTATPSGYTVSNVPFASIVDLKVPAVDPSGYQFAYWTVNGTAQTAGLREITPAMTAGGMTLVALYNATLTVNDNSPSHGLAIGSATGDGGYTNYAVSYVAYNASVDLSAPATDPTGYTFSQWQWTMNGTAQTSALKDLTFTMTSATTAQAQYTLNTYLLTVNSTPPTGLFIASSGAYSGATDYTVSNVGYNSSVNLVAPATAPGGYVFTCWTLNGVNQNPNQTTLTFALPAQATTAVANYLKPIQVQVQSTPPNGAAVGSSDSPSHAGTTAAAGTAGTWANFFEYTCPTSANVPYSTASALNVQAPTLPGLAFVQWWVPQTGESSTSANSSFTSPVQTTNFGSFQNNRGADNNEGIAYDATNHVLYAMDEMDQFLYKYSLNGTLLTSWPGTGVTGGGQAFATGGNGFVEIGVSPDGNYVYTEEYDSTPNCLIQKYDSTGHFITSWWNGIGNGTGFAVGPDGNVYVQYGGNQFVWSPTGTQLANWSPPLTGTGLSWVHGAPIAFDGRGYMYIASVDGATPFVAIYTPTGIGVGATAWTFRTVITNGGGNALAIPCAVACDANNNLYVTNEGSAALGVMEFNYSGGVVTYLNNFPGPSGTVSYTLAVDSAGNVYTLPENMKPTHIYVVHQGMLAQAQYAPGSTLNVQSTPTGVLFTSGTYTGQTPFSDSVVNGASVTLAAPPSTTGYLFTNWTGLPGGTTSVNPITFTMPAATVTAVANYTLQSYALSVQSTPSGLGITGSYTGTSGTTPYGPTSVPYLTSVTLTAPSTTGYTFSNWTGLPGGTTSANPVTFNMPGQAVTAQAIYTQNTLTVTASVSAPEIGIPILITQGSNDSTGVQDGGTTNYSVTGLASLSTVDLSVPATDPTGFTFQYWTLTGPIQTTSREFTITLPPSGIMTAVATYQGLPYTLTVQSTPPSVTISSTSTPSYGGPATPTGYTDTVNAGTSVNLTAPATDSSTGYVFSQWVVGPTAGFPSGATNYSTNTINPYMLTQDMTAQAVYTPNSFQLTVQSTPPTGVVFTSGTYTGTTTFGASVPYLTSVTLTAPATVPGYAFSSWTGVTGGTPSGNSITFTMPAGALTATANYTIQSYGLTVQSTPPTGVAVTGTDPGTTPYGPTSILYGTSVNLVAGTNPANYTFACWTVNGVALTAGWKNVTFPMPGQPTTAVATYGGPIQVQVQGPSSGLLFASSTGHGGTTAAAGTAAPWSNFLEYTCPVADNIAYSTAGVTLTAAVIPGYTLTQWWVPQTGATSAAATSTFTSPPATTNFGSFSNYNGVYSGQGVAYDPNNNLIYTFAEWDGKVYKYTLSGQLLTSWTGSGINNLGNSFGTGGGYDVIAISPDGNYIYTQQYDSINVTGSSGQIQKYDSVGNWQASWYGIGNGQAFACDAAGNLYQGYGGEQRIYTSTGTLLADWGPPLTGTGLSWVHGGYMTFDGRGYMYLSAYEGNFVAIYTPTGSPTPGASAWTFRTVITTGGGLNLNTPMGLACDANNNLYVSNTGSSTLGVMEFNYSGGVVNYLGNFLINGGNPVVLPSTGGVATAMTVDSAGNVYTPPQNMKPSHIYVSYQGMLAQAQYGTSETLNVDSAPMTGLGITGTYPVTTNSVLTVGAGAEILLTAPAVTGYSFTGWTGVTGTLSGNSITFTMPAAAVTATANYSLNSYGLTVQSTPLTGVAITGTYPGTTNYGPTSVPYNTSETLTAPDVAGYIFAGWTGVTGTPSGNSITFTMPGADTTAVAQYTPLFTLTVQSTDILANPLPGIAITGTYPGTTTYSVGSIAQGTSVNLVAPTADPSGTYVFTQWTLNSVSQTPAEPSITFPMTADTTAVAQYTLNTFPLAVQSTPPTGVVIGSSSMDGGTTNYPVSAVTYGASVDLVAPDADPTGYTFVKWTLNGADQTAGQKTLDFTMPASATTAVAEYILNTYTLTVQSTPPTGVVITSSGADGGTTNYTVSSVGYGTSVNLVAPDADPTGYTFSQWTVNGTAQPAAQKSITFTMTADTTAVAEYTLNTYTLTVQSTPPTGVVITSSGADGGTTNYTESSVGYGTSVNLVAPDADPTGYTFSQWTVNGTAQPAAQKSITFTMTADTTAVAEYTLNTYTLTVQSTPPTGVVITSSGADGGTTNYTVSSVAYGTSVNLVAPDADPTGYTFSQWTVGGTAQPAAQKSITFTMTGDTTAVAEYTLNTYTLTVQSTPPTGVVITSSGADGGTTNYTESSVGYGTSVNLVAPATDPTGYTFSEWTVGGTAQTAGLKSITFTMTGDTTAVAGYTLNAYTLTVQSTPPTGVVIGSSGADGGTTNYTESSVTYGASVNLVAPDADPTGYAFSEWTVNGTAQPAGQKSITFTMTGDTTAVADYAATYTLTVQSTPLTGLAVTGTYPGTTNYTAAAVGGSSVTLTAPAVTGYLFKQWQLTGATGTPSASSITFTMPAGAVTAVASYVVSYNLVVQSTPVPGLAVTGTYAGTTSYTVAVASGSSVTVTAPATDPHGYAFLHWTENGVAMPAGKGPKTITFTMNRALTVVAVYTVSP